MCGRYTLTTVERELAEEFDLIIDGPGLRARYNIAPTQDAPVVRASEDGESRCLAMHRWGLIPFWAKEASFGARTINARSEDAAEKPSFREAMKQRRCIVPCAGFFEWKSPESDGGKSKRVKKQPYYIRRRDERVFGLAGLWERWRSPAGESIDSYTILTTSPNELLATLHDRMPVILHLADYDLWLDPKVRDARKIQPLCKPFDSNDLIAYPVGFDVNSPSNDNPSCIKELPVN